MILYLFEVNFHNHEFVNLVNTKKSVLLQHMDYFFVCIF